MSHGSWVLPRIIIAQFGINRGIWFLKRVNMVGALAQWVKPPHEMPTVCIRVLVQVRLLCFWPSTLIMVSGR